MNIIAILEIRKYGRNMSLYDIIKSYVVDDIYIVGEDWAFNKLFRCLPN